MLPIYIGNLGDWSPELSEPRSLSDDLSEEEQEDLASWASSLGSTSTTTASSHKATSDSDGGEPTSDSSGADESADDNEPRPEFEDDPMDWIRRDIEGEPE
jgi:DNA replication initiation complex subunit (GINS family)